MKKEDEATKDRIIRIIFDLEKEDYYKPVKLGNFWSKSYIEYEIDGDRNKIQSYLKNILIKLDHI